MSSSTTRHAVFAINLLTIMDAVSDFVESDYLCVNTDCHLPVAASPCDLYQDEPGGLRKIEYSFKVS